MIGHCETFAPTLLALIGRRLAECVDPDGTQARDEKSSSNAKSPPGRSGPLRSSRTRTAPAGSCGGTPTPKVPQRRHDAFAELCRRQLAAGELPSTGGIKPRVVITIPAQSLEDRTGAGRLNDGFQISPSLARYFGCDAEIIPCFLDRNGNLIDLGRAQRLFTGPARLALELRDRGCAWPGCDRPLSWCEAHHVLGWHRGGGTDQSNGVLLCGFHHREIERGDWQVFICDGRAWSRPPAWIHPQRKPLFNPMHHPPPI